MTQGKMIAVFKHLEGNHREEEWHFLRVRPEGRASPIVWAGVQRWWILADWKELPWEFRVPVSCHQLSLRPCNCLSVAL